MASFLSNTSAQLLRARLGVFGAFTIVGFLTAIWLVNIPDIQQRTGASHAVLGGLILLLGLGALISMQFAGLLIRRFGSRTPTLMGLGLLLVSVNLPGMASDALSLGIGLFIFGLGHGLTDVAMNQHAVVVERGYRRPIMSAFHAFFSLGGALGAVAGAAGQSIHLHVSWILLGAALLGLVGTAWSAFSMLPKASEELLDLDQNRAAPSATGSSDHPVAPKRGRMLALALLAFLVLLSEGAANDWSALQTVERLGEPEAAAALAYGAFAAAMTIGRLLADRISHAIGPVKVVRFGSLIAATGMLVVVASSFYPLSLFGWLLFGLGLSGIIPQVYSAAGSMGRSDAGKTLSRVVSSGYIGLLAGPAIIGWLGGMLGLTFAFLLPLLFCVAGIFLASTVTRDSESLAELALAASKDAES
ncbi:MFS transporter [Arthrobacter sp. MI7-26]|uniref:MFS transporter n=1 Tax=Arthrobacter sp. MI7-26 TaxID=2993653 RepID=UPI0022495143|nr:MFS transporter [Arthrobacter sp. MI7-26]MCX2750526.1 MFS transporter [Arthrobacter sp. MI7-26]